MWDLEFTKRIPLDDTIAGHLSVSGDKDFRTLYQCLLDHAAEQQDGTLQVNSISSMSSVPVNTNPNICVRKCSWPSGPLKAVCSKALAFLAAALNRVFALQSIWSILGENRVSIKSLVAVLSFFVLAGKAKKASVQQRVSGLHAASLYLLLLGVQGEEI